MPLKAIHINLDTPGDALSSKLGAERRNALREYADALRHAGFSVRVGTYDVRASLGTGVGPSISLVVDGRVILERVNGVRVSGRLTAHGRRPSAAGAVAAAQQWLSEGVTPRGWSEHLRSTAGQDATTCAAAYTDGAA
jgi:hypothetical protein